MTKNLATNYRSGFTLLEAIIYSALFGILLTGVLLTSYPLLEGSARGREKAYIEMETIFIMAKIRYALAHNITTKNALSNLVPQEGDIATSTLHSKSGGFTFQSQGTDLIYSEGLASLSPLHSSRNKITNFFVIHERALGGPGFLTISWKTNGGTVGPFKIYFNF